MSKSINAVPIIEDPIEVALQFDVKTDGEKAPKYSQKQIFELGKKKAVEKKGKSKADKLKEDRAKAVNASARSQSRQSELRKKGYNIS
tara:strand:+ start:3212 stop:3475 length:264 start_codon:yes stop_codon:yes gene_type:complete